MKTADLCDALDTIEACAETFLSYGRKRSFSGPIRTVQCFEDIVELRKRVNERGDGCVLVVDGGGSTRRAIFGDNMAALMVKNGWSGVVVNGAARDVADIDAMDLGLKALATIPKRGEKNGGGRVDVLVSFGGVTFVPDSWVVADEDGVVVLPEGSKPDDIDVTAGALTYS